MAKIILKAVIIILIINTCIGILGSFGLYRKLWNIRISAQICNISGIVLLVMMIVLGIVLTRKSLYE